MAWQAAKATIMLIFSEMVSDDVIPINRLIAWLIYKEKISTTPSLDGGVGTPQRGDKRRGA